MKFKRQTPGRAVLTGVAGAMACGILALTLMSGGAQPAAADGAFPFDRDLLLDAAPMRPAKRVPILSVAPDGNATIDLWCQTVAARVQVSAGAIRVEPGPLPPGLPQYMSDGQCTPQRMQADQDMLAAFAQVTEWRQQGRLVVLNGPTTLKFRLSDH